MVSLKIQIEDPRSRASGTAKAACHVLAVPVQVEKPADKRKGMVDFQGQSVNLIMSSYRFQKDRLLAFKTHNTKYDPQGIAGSAGP